MRKLLLQHNEIGREELGIPNTLGPAIENHPNLTYLDISYNQIQNTDFATIFSPISRNKTKMENF